MLTLSLLPVDSSNTSRSYMSYSYTHRELAELQHQGLVGNESYAAQRDNSPEAKQDPDEFHLFQWDSDDNALWQALRNEGEAGKQAAQHLEAMVAERRSHVSSYLNDFHSLTHKLAQGPGIVAGAPLVDLDTLLDNAAAGRVPVRNADGSLVANSDQITAFWQQNQDVIQRMQETLNTLEDQPQHLSEWLDRNSIDRPVQVDEVIEKHRFSGVDQRTTTSETLRASAVTVLNENGSNQASQATRGDQYDYINTDTLGMTQDGVPTGTSNIRIPELRIPQNFSSYVEGAARALMQQDKQQAIQDYNGYYRPVADTFSTTFSPPLEPRFTLQDMLNSLSQFDDPSHTASGDQHPATEEIQAFYTQHKSRIDHLLTMQQGVEQFPDSTEAWLEDADNRARANAQAQATSGLEPWQTGRNANSFMHNEMGIFSEDAKFNGGLPIEDDEWRMIQEAEAGRVEQALLDKFRQFRTDNPDFEGLTFKDIVHNFRNGLPLGQQSDGTVHPMNDQLEALFSDAELGDYLRSEWLRPPTLNPEQGSELVQLILEQMEEGVSISDEMGLVSDAFRERVLQLKTDEARSRFSSQSS